MELRPRKWVPPINVIADQLVEDGRTATSEGELSMDITRSLGSWQETARDHGEEFTEDDWFALVEELVRRIILAPEEWYHPPPEVPDEPPPLS
jgi:hypothetical protein